MRGVHAWKAWAVAAALFMTACFRTTFESARTPEHETHRIWIDEYFYGLIGSGEFDTRLFCEAPAVRIGVRQNAATVALTVLTLGVYTPRVAEITCGPAPAARQGT